VISTVNGAIIEVQELEDPDPISPMTSKVAMVRVNKAVTGDNSGGCNNAMLSYVTFGMLVVFSVLLRRCLWSIRKKKNVIK
jgi:hypothetical protein